MLLGGTAFAVNPDPASVSSVGPENSLWELSFSPCSWVWVNATAGLALDVHSRGGLEKCGLIFQIHTAVALKRRRRARMIAWGERSGTPGNGSYLIRSERQKTKGGQSHAHLFGAARGIEIGRRRSAT